jgi:hypothetical protein
VGFSTRNAEFVAASKGTKEMLWLERLLGELGGNGTKVRILYVDNARAVKPAKNPEFYKRSKHF